MTFFICYPRAPDDRLALIERLCDQLDAWRIVWDTTSPASDIERSAMVCCAHGIGPTPVEARLEECVRSSRWTNRPTGAGREQALLWFHGHGLEREALAPAAAGPSDFLGDLSVQQGKIFIIGGCFTSPDSNFLRNDYIFSEQFQHTSILERNSKKLLLLLASEPAGVDSLAEPFAAWTLQPPLSRRGWEFKARGTQIRDTSYQAHLRHLLPESMTSIAFRAPLRPPVAVLDGATVGRWRTASVLLAPLLDLVHNSRVSRRRRIKPAASISESVPPSAKPKRLLQYSVSKYFRMRGLHPRIPTTVNSSHASTRQERLFGKAFRLGKKLSARMTNRHGPSQTDGLLIPFQAKPTPSGTRDSIFDSRLGKLMRRAGTILAFPANPFARRTAPHLQLDAPMRDGSKPKVPLVPDPEDIGPTLEDIQIDDFGRNIERMLAERPQPPPDRRDIG